MSVEEVRLIHPKILIDKEYYFSNKFLTFITQSLFNSELISVIPQPHNNINGKFYRYLTGENLSNNDLTFYFNNDKLVAISTYFHCTTALNDLKQRYGNGFIVNLLHTDNAIVWNNHQRGRFITWEGNNERGINSREEVIYI